MKKFKFKRVLSLVMTLIMVLSVALICTVSAGAADSNSALEDVSKSLLQVRLVYNYKGTDIPVFGATGFLINENTILTAGHLINYDEDVKEAFKSIDSEYDESNISYEVVVKADVIIKATVEQKSDAYDMAIMTLNQPIGNRTIVQLAPKLETPKSMPVYALGFPQSISDVQDKSLYDYSDVTITSGNVQKTTEINGAEFIQHGAEITGGNSGGPLVNEDGAVIGINVSGFTDEDYGFATKIWQITEILDALKIEWTEYSGSNSAATEAETEAESKPESKIVSSVPEVSSVPVTSSNSTTDKPDNRWIIFVAIGVLLLALIAVVIIIIVINNKKKNNNGPKGGSNGPTQFPGPGGMPGGMNGGMPGGQNGPRIPSSPNGPNAPYQRPPVTPGYDSMATVPSNEGSEGTTVLSGDAGATSVLGAGMGAPGTSFTLVRKATGEKVNINKSRYVIGKERRKVDYCISDNSSVSRAHAAILVKSGRAYITDLGSTNCTYVNGSKVDPNKEVVLSKGDKVTISDEEFEFLG